MVNNFLKPIKDLRRCDSGISMNLRMSDRPLLSNNSKIYIAFKETSMSLTAYTSIEIEKPKTRNCIVKVPKIK